MERHQIQLQNFEENEYKLPGLWDKSWVRPLESIWSIFNTYKAVNAIHDNATLMKAIGADIKSNIVNEYFLSYGIFCNISSRKNNIDEIISRLVPKWYKIQIEEFMIKREVSEFFSDKISYCPECMKNGYHSIIHQLKGIKKCPFHKSVSLIPYLKQRYILGHQSPYEYDRNNTKRACAFAARNFSMFERTNFENLSSLPLPSERKDYLSEVETFLNNGGLRKDFDYIKPIGSDLNDKNIIPEIGSFFINHELEPKIIIKDIEKADELVIQKIVDRFRKNGVEYRYMIKNHLRIVFKYVFLQIFIIEKLKPFTLDEIDYKCYQIERGKFISSEDELGMILLYLLFVTGDDRIEESLSLIRNTNDVEQKYCSNFQYYPSDVCIHELQIHDFCIAAQYYILDDYLQTNLDKFKEYVKPLKGMEKPLRRHDLILYPAHMIYVKEKNTVKIYQY